MTVSPMKRDLVLARAKYRCEYCQSPEFILLSMEVDHIVPKSKGGGDSEENLALACPSCNERKFDFQTGIDPDTGEEQPLFNPRTQVWHEHFLWNEDFTAIVGLTPAARATISRLKMNREKMIAARKLWISVGWHPPKD